MDVYRFRIVAEGRRKSSGYSCFVRSDSASQATELTVLLGIRGRLKIEGSWSTGPCGDAIREALPRAERVTRPAESAPQAIAKRWYW